MQPQRQDDSNPMLPLPCRVVGEREEIPGCRTLIVETAEKCASTAFAPGQFYMLYAFGHGEVPISASGNLAFTIMNVGSVTAALCALERGAMVGLRGPFGSAWPLTAAKGRDIVVMAGGLGLAPLRPVIEHVLARRSDFGRVNLLYGARRPEIILFREEIEAWQARGLEAAITVDHAGRDWHGHVGVVTDLIKDLKFDPLRALAMICGPEIMMRFSVQALRATGLQVRDMYVSMERNMKCAIARCGRCQYGPYFICKDGPVFAFDRVERLFRIREA